MTAVRLAATAAHFGRDVVRSMERVATVLAAAHRVEAALCVLPDATLGGCAGGRDLPPVLAPDAPELEQVMALAGDMVVCLGYWEAVGPGRRPAAVCLSGRGVHGRYRRVHRAPDDGAGGDPGTALAAFDTPLGRLGMLVGQDKAFPEAARTLALDGARVIACLCAWPASDAAGDRRMTRDGESRLFDLYDSARAAENQLVWVAANQTGTHHGRRFLGQAKVVGPRGEVLARTWAKGGLAVAELDVDAEIDRVRGAVPHLAQRRPELYREW